MVRLGCVCGGRGSEVTVLGGGGKWDREFVIVVRESVV